MTTVNVKLKSLREDIVLPSYAHPGDSGMDLRSTIDFELEPFQRIIVPCGFSIELPAGYGGFVLPRSGLASKKGVTVANAPGLIDSGYRGEVCVALVNLNSEQKFVCKSGERIAQLVIMQTPEISLFVSEELSDSQRGSGGFGSSGMD